MSKFQEALLPSGLAAARPAAGHAGRLYYSTDTQVLERDTGAAWETYAGGGGSAGLYESYCCVVDQKAQATDGGGFTLGAWRTRDIQTEQSDPDGIVVLAGNQITLDSGTYRCLISCPAYRVSRHQARLYNTTGAALVLTGTSEWMSSGADTTVTLSVIVGGFTIVGGQALEIQHRCQTTQAVNGFGVNSNFGAEIYTTAEFWKET